MVVESYGQDCNGRDPVKSEGLKKDGSTRDVKYVPKDASQGRNGQ